VGQRRDRAGAPSAQAELGVTGDDFASPLGNVAAFLRDPQRGVPRFIAIVRG
jgi:hypothetical protein